MKKLPSMMMGAGRTAGGPSDEEDEDEDTMPGSGDPNALEEGGENDPSTGPDDDGVADSDMSIPLPEGFKAPGDAKDGETFEIIAKAKIEDGRIVFESLDGQAPKPKTQTSEESDESAEDELRDAMRKERMG